MKTLLALLVASLLSAQITTTHFKKVNFNGTTIRNVIMVTNDVHYTIDLWYKQTLLLENYMIVSCKTPEGYCLIEKTSWYGWIEKERQK